MFQMNYYELKIVQNEMELYQLAQKLKKSKYRYFDTETTGLRVRYKGNDSIVGWTFAVDDEIDTKVYYIPTGHEFEGEYTSHVDFEKLKLNPKDFPYFDEEKFAGDWVNLDLDAVIQALLPAFYDQSGIWVAHNITFDLHVLASHGIDVERMTIKGNYFDTMVAFHTVDEEAEKKLETIIKKRYQVIKTDFNDVVATVSNEEKKALGFKTVSTKASFQHVQIPIGAYYSGEDVWFMKQLMPDVIQELVEDGQDKLFYRLRMPFLMVLWKMERRGVKVDKKKLDIMTKKAKEELDAIEYSIYEICGVKFNIGSGQQVAEILHGHKKKIKDKKLGGYKESYNNDLVMRSFGFPVVSWTAGGADKDKKLQNPQTNADSLKEMLEIEWSKKLGVAQSYFEKGKKVVRLLLKYARLEKLYSAFMKGLAENMYQDGCVHPSFNNCGTDSWRLSCDSPNLQQLPRPLEMPKAPPKDEQEKYAKYLEEKAEYDFWIQFEIRELFIADEEDEVIIAGDWSNLEKRISAHMTKDPALIRMFMEELDGHGLIATMIFPELADVHPNDVKKYHKEERQIAKGVGFAIDYGGTSFAVSRNLGIDKEVAQSYIDRYFEGFSGIAEWAINQKQFGRKYGYVLTILGHKRHLSKIRSENIKERSYYERLCLNAPVQGSAADIAIRAQLAIDKDPILRAMGYTMRIQIHDEIVGTCPARFKFACMERVKYLMEHCLPQELVVPLISNIDWGMTYAEAK